MEILLPEPLVKLAHRIVALNLEAGRRITVAESCTGGLVAAALTEVPGSSGIFECGFVTYSNEAKMTLLGVNSDVLETFGSVSVATAWAMAQGALDRTGADVAVSITGIAGPAGGSEKKPVGTVVFARAERGGNPDKVFADLKLFEDTGRAGVRLQAALCALELLVPPGMEP